jgi:hypothetical protein
VAAQEALMSNLEVVGAANVLAGTTGLGLAGALAAAVSRQTLNEASVSALDAKNPMAGTGRHWVRDLPGDDRWRRPRRRR